MLATITRLTGIDNVISLKYPFLDTDGIDEIANFKKRWQAAKAEHDGKALDWCFALMKRYCLRNSTIIISSR